MKNMLLKVLTVACAAAIASPLLVQPALGADFVELAKAGDLSFGRNAVSGLLAIEQQGKGVTVDPDSRLNFYPQGAFEFDGAAYLLVYNTATNVPSGRRLSRGEEGNDLYRVSVAGGEASFEHVATMPFGIDMTLKTSVAGDALITCGTISCLRLERRWSGKTTFTPVRFPTGYETMELSGRYVLLQRYYNDQVEDLPPAATSIFQVCSIADTLSDCRSVPPDQIPYDLKADGTYAIATDFEKLLKFDYKRLGVANYSEPNLEGRLVWSNVYFLCGLSALYHMPISESFKAEVKGRLVKEVEAIARLGETAYPRFLVRRYSMDREPVEFLLHYARIAKTIERARSTIGDGLANRALANILPELVAPRMTVESLAMTPRAEVQYRKYAPFWADGINVPWNYQNAWIEALGLTHNLDKHADYVASLIAAFADDEKLASKPQKWGYAGGLFYEGWSGNVSSNTPSWGGQKTSNSVAHISYRSMDALALLEAERASIPVPFGRARIAELIKTGYLYPFVAEGMPEPVEIPFHIARHYARSSLPWQFKNQAWVLGGLIMSASPQ